MDPNASYSLVVLGASGDLAKKKLYPCLLRLFVYGLLPPKLSIVGYSRTAIKNEDFRARIKPAKPPAGSRPEQVEAFLSINHYVAGNYDSVEDMKRLAQELTRLEASLGGQNACRFFYMAVPPSVFVAAARAVHDGALADTSTGGWNRVVVEKPFGRDLLSSRELQKQLASNYTEDMIYRIDHYLGKEQVQNLNVLRFANLFMQPTWNKEFISLVQITFKEDIGTEGRGGYFDNFGIIRDVMQNHLLQVMTLVAMEPPVTLSAEDIRNEKVKVLRAIPPITMDNIVVGQFDGYLDEPDVPKTSITPTYAAARLSVNNGRWSGVPFILKCGKALNERKAEIRIQFRAPPNFLFRDALPNELVIRLQPNEAIYLKMMSKSPGMSREITQIELDLNVRSRFAGSDLPDAYEHLINDVFHGDHSLFVRSDELEQAWRVFTPVLHELEATPAKLIKYQRGTRGPAEADGLLQSSGYMYTGHKYSWPRSEASPIPRKASLGSKPPV
jgi:glucose-6-phosphate 1-dehydrogenase